MRPRPSKIKNKQINSTSAKPKRRWQRLGLAALIAASVGVTGCQTFRLPGNPFANSRMGLSKLPVPRLPSLAKLPKPNFGNIKRSITTPTQEVISSSNMSTSIANAKKQPPPPPARVFESSATDQKIALAEANSPKVAPKPAFDFSSAASDANTEMTSAQKRFKEALSGNPTTSSNLASASSAKPLPNSSLWGDYQPDRGPSSSNNPVVNRVADLAKVNHKLYDQYGKLRSSKTAKLSDPMDTKMFAAKISGAEIEKTNQSVADLRTQLEKMKTRGAGSSDDFTLPTRSAVELAGSAPIKIEEKVEVPNFKGFGDDARFSRSQELASNRTVNIPDPTAPKNVLRASTNQTPGLVKTVEIAGPGQYQSTSGKPYRGYATTTAPKDLPTGNLLPAGGDERVANEFVQAMNQQEIPTLTATPKSFEMPLQREVSDASLAAIELNKRAAAAVPPPKISYQKPFAGTKVLMPNKPAAQPASFVAAPVAAPVATPAVSAPPSAFQMPATQTVRVTKNQFFNRPIESSAPLQMPAMSGERVAQASKTVETTAQGMMSILPKSSGSTSDLPESLISGSGDYAPGSVVRPQSEPLWR